MIQAQAIGRVMAPSWRPLTLVLLCALAYGTAITSDFAYDDNLAVTSNPVVGGRLPLAAAFTRDYWGRPPAHTIGSYRPIALVSLALDARIVGNDQPWLFHATNVLVHTLVVLALFWVFRPLAQEGIAFGAAALFAVLAAPSEAILAIVGRADLLLALFALLGLWSYLGAGRWRGALSILCFALALGSKENALVLPLVWLAVEKISQREIPRRRWLGYLAVASAYLVGRHFALGGVLVRNIEPLQNPLWEAPLLARVLGAGKVLLTRYGGGIVNPTLRLYDCSAPACGPAVTTDTLAWAGLALAVSLALVPVLARRRAPMVAAGLAWFVLLFFPVSNLLVLGPTIYGERLLYAPIAGLALAASAGTAWLAARTRRNVLAWGLLATFGLANALALLGQHRAWRSSRALFLAGLEQAPMSAKVQTNAAWAYIEAGEVALAESHARLAIALEPRQLTPHGILGSSLDLQGRPAEADRAFRDGLARGQDGMLVFQYATFLGRHGQYAPALALTQRFLALDPDDTRVRDLATRLERRILATPKAP